MKQPMREKMKSRKGKTRRGEEGEPGESTKRSKNKITHF